MRTFLPILATALAVAALPAPAASPTPQWSVSSHSSLGGALVPASAEGAAVDAAGDLVVAATDAAQGCIVTLKYFAANGALAWRREACGGAGTAATSVAVDAAGNVVVLGNSGGTFRLIKYSGASGSPLWDRRFAGEGLERAHGMALDRAGDVVMMGQPRAASFEIWVAKHRGTDGTLAWQQPVDAGAEVTPAGVALDANGNAFVAGTYRNSRGDEDWHLAKLAGSSGAVLWRKIHDSGARDFASALTVDAAGDPTVAGVMVSGAATVISVVKSYNATGRQVWEAVHAAAGGARALAVRHDAAGNIHVTGSADDDMVTLRFAAADGRRQWLATYAGAGAGGDFGRSIAFDAQGNVAVAGRSLAPGGSEMRILEYAADGAQRWTAAQGRGSDDAGYAIVAARDALYAVGVATVSGVAGLRVVKYAAADQVLASAAINVQGLWWKSDEPGWGVNLAQQGEVLFATWFTYDEQGQGLWLVMSEGRRVGDNSYAGTLYRTRGPSFNAARFDPAQVAASPVGEASFTFDDAARGIFRYTVNGASGAKAITRQVYAAPVPTCAAGGSAGALPNYQDLWWAPGGAESGWGLNVTHQGDTLFITWFTYGPDGRGMWIVGSSVAKTGNATYAGTLYRTVGPPFDASPWDASRVGVAAAGHVRLAFSDAENGTFTYTLDGVSQSKAITRQAFASPRTTCG